MPWLLSVVYLCTFLSSKTRSNSTKKTNSVDMEKMCQGDFRRFDNRNAKVYEYWRTWRPRVFYSACALSDRLRLHETWGKGPRLNSNVLLANQNWSRAAANLLVRFEQEINRKTRDTRARSTNRVMTPDSVTRSYVVVITPSWKEKENTVKPLLRRCKSSRPSSYVIS